MLAFPFLVRNCGGVIDLGLMWDEQQGSGNAVDVGIKGNQQQKKRFGTDYAKTTENCAVFGTVRTRVVK